MKIWTWLELKNEIETELDLEEEIFVTPTELLGYANQAIDEAEAEIHGIYSKYFETEVKIALVTGTDEYSLPSDIYAAKITGIFHNDGSRKYPIKRVRDLEELDYIETNDDYKYRIVNDSTLGFQLKLYPTSRSTDSTIATMHYLRNANRLVDDTSTVDLPEAIGFIKQWIKDAIMNKEDGSLFSAPPSLALVRQRNLLLDTLADMTPDGDNVIAMDTSFYEDFDMDDFNY